MQFLNEAPIERLVTGPPTLLMSAGHFHVQQAVSKAGGIRPEQEDLFSTTEFEQHLWQEYGLIGDVDPEHLFKECQRKAREAEDETLQKFTISTLNALDTIHKMRKQFSHNFILGQEGLWPEVEEAPPNDQSKTIGQNFWAVLIGNDKYAAGKELYGEIKPHSVGHIAEYCLGCINDTQLMRDYLLEYLGVPKDHIRLLHNASREAILDALYDLRDNVHIQFEANILVHFSGHGSSYDAESFFESASGSAGSIEAICPSDRSADYEIPDISDREINIILSEVRDAKGGNITFIADCCYSGGMMRTNPITDEALNRSVMPIRLGPMSMLKAAEEHPRRKSSVLASSDSWKGDVAAFVQLAACQDFQQAREVAQDGRKYGAFTWALAKVLKSTKSQGRTYTDIVRMLGRPNRNQTPKVMGERKESQLWFK